MPTPFNQPINLVGGGLIVASCIGLASSLIQQNWQILSNKTTFRYFKPGEYSLTADPEDIWNNGEDIHCQVNDDLSVNLILPQAFDNSKEFKMFTHGFISEVREFVKFVPAWMSASQGKVNVILVDWSELSAFFQMENYHNYAYDTAARNAIDVGEFVGHCLVALADQVGVDLAQVHMAGHSLGAHLCGKAGRVVHNTTAGAHSLGRVTGLDPAGPRFLDGPVCSAIEELNMNRLDNTSASFVDVIHTDGAFNPALAWFHSRLGDLNQIGHMDFYPQGGEQQPGCEYSLFSICSHERSVFYYYHSILEPSLLIGRACEDIESCREGIIKDNNTIAEMGENSKDYISEERQLFYLEVEDSNWDFDTHNKESFFRTKNLLGARSRSLALQNQMSRGFFDCASET